MYMPARHVSRPTSKKCKNNSNYLIDLINEFRLENLCTIKYAYLHIYVSYDNSSSQSMLRYISLIYLISSHSNNNSSVEYLMRHL